MSHLKSAVAAVAALSLSVSFAALAYRAAPETPRRKVSAPVAGVGQAALFPGSGLTYARDIAPILGANCVSCHRPGEVAPFSLLSYEDARNHAAVIAAVAEKRTMPPWKAAPDYGDFSDARRLTAEQIGLLRQWVAEGAPRGKMSDLPPLPKFTEGWTLGKPDLEIEPDRAYTVGAEGRDVYRCFVLPTGFAEDRYVSAVELRPGNRAVVHHVLLFLDTSGAARKLAARSSEPGYEAFGGLGFLPAGGLGGWAPGNLPRRLPKGVGMLLPKGADLVMQVHYHRSGKQEQDRTRIGLYFVDAPVDKQLHVLPVINPFLRIPAGEKNHRVDARLPVLTDVTLLQVTPHMHLLGRDMTVAATLPDGGTKPIVRIPDWNFNWQTTYTYKQPVRLPKGSRIDLVAHYDNSADNPRNPSSPPKVVTWGEQTTDEMCIAFVGFTIDSEHLLQGVRAPDLYGSLRGNRRGSVRPDSVRQ